MSEIHHLKHAIEKSYHHILLFTIIILASVSLGACSLFQRGRFTPTPELISTVPSDEESLATEVPAPVMATEAVEDDVPDEFLDKLWVLVAYGNPASPTVVEPGLVVTAEFNSNGNLSGSTGCNNYSAEFKIDDKALEVGLVASTMMVCETGDEQEKAYLEAIESVESYLITPEGRLEITYNLGRAYETRLIFSEGQVPLRDTTWVLISYGDADEPSDVEPGTSITAVFTDEGTISGSSGCNNYTAAFALTGENGLSINPPISTRMLCPQGMDQEASYLDLLPKAEDYQIYGSRMEISYGSGAGRLLFSSLKFPFENTLWTLVALNGGPVADTAPMTMQFSPDEDPETGIVGGVVGCNNYNADYRVDPDGGLKIEDVATTFMACTPSVMDIEQSYLNVLKTIESYSILGNQLTVKSPLAILTFKADRTALEGTNWSLVSMGEETTPQSPVPGSLFSIQFIREPDEPTGNVRGYTGCKEYSSAYIASLTEMKINPVDVKISQECEAAIITQEQTYFLLLGQASTYQIVGNLLVINVGDGAVLNYIAEPPLVDTNPDLSALNGTYWFLSMLDDQSVLPGVQITALFNVNADNVSGSINGSSGCNTYSGNIQSGFIVETPSVTEKVCNQPIGVMDQEALYLEMLPKTRGYSLKDDQLVIVTTSGHLIFSSTPLEAPPDPKVLLLDRTWYLTSINNNAAIPGYEPRAYFAGDGSLSGHTGCNLYSSRFITELSSLAISLVVKTEDPCNEPMNTQEIAFINALQAVSEYKVSSTTLQLVGINGVLNFSSIPPVPAKPTPTRTPVATSLPTATSGNLPTTTPPSGSPSDPVGMISAPEDGYIGQLSIPINFDATGSEAEAGILKYTWEFGDGTGPIDTRDPAIEYTFNEAGNFLVTMFITDNNAVISEPVSIIVIITSPQ